MKDEARESMARSLGQGFGADLKHWRGRRGLSQMELGLRANVSARHVSFLETGRARPSREMVLRLASVLQVPGAACNSLLQAAGFASAYVSRAAGDAELKPLSEAISWMLQRHAPYPAFAIDRHWRLQSLNTPAQMLLKGVGVCEGESLLEALLSNAALRQSLENLEQIEALTLERVRTELVHFGSDPILEQAVNRLSQQVVASGYETEAEQDGPMSAIIPARYRFGGQILSFFSTLTQFGGVGDVAMSELRIEMMFPADDVTAGVLHGAMGQAPEHSADVLKRP